jgi:hypothetical protein
MLKIEHQLRVVLFVEQTIANMGDSYPTWVLVDTMSAHPNQ